MLNKGILVLEDGAVYTGISIGAEGERLGEVIFNTSMTGYQEILTDPSYKGQMVVMTYPLIGNYGINPEDVQSSKIHCEAFLLSENSALASNYRSRGSLADYLKANNVLGLTGLDTRALTKHLRLRGSMKGIVSTLNFDTSKLLEKVKKWPGIGNQDLVKTVSRHSFESYSSKGKLKFVVIDCGVKNGILEELKKRGCEVVVVPSSYNSARILEFKPHAVLISNGPGDPSALHSIIKTASGLIGKLPLFGICLGHQILGLAFGAKTYKLKFGHHGANHPVKKLDDGKVFITSQNHNYCVDLKSARDKNLKMTHLNLYDNTEAGMRHTKLPVYSVQFHPEASPGPRESALVFDEFISITKKYYAKR